MFYLPICGRQQTIHDNKGNKETWGGTVYSRIGTGAQEGLAGNVGVDQDQRSFITIHIE